MSFVLTKRPVDVIDHTMDFTNYLPEGLAVTAAEAKVVGEADNTLSIVSVTVASPLVTVRVADGTAEAIYQVYVTATFGAAV